MLPAPRLWLPLLAIAFLSPLAGTTHARPADRPATAPAQSQRNPGAILGRVKELTGELNLSDEQKTRVKGIFEQSLEDLKATAAANKDATPQEKMTKMRELLASVREKIDGVLTDAQKAEFNDKLQNLHPAGPTTGPGGRGPGAMLQRLKDNLDKLDLNDDQKAKIDDLLKSTKQQMEDIRSQVQAGTLERSAVRDKVTTLIAEQKEKLMSILTPDQQENLKGLMQNGQDDSGPTRGGDGKTPPASKPSVAVPVQPAVQVAIGSHDAWLELDARAAR